MGKKKGKKYGGEKEEKYKGGKNGRKSYLMEEGSGEKKEMK